MLRMLFTFSLLTSVLGCGDDDDDTTFRDAGTDAATDAATAFDSGTDGSSQDCEHPDPGSLPEVCRSEAPAGVRVDEWMVDVPAAPVNPFCATALF